MNVTTSSGRWLLGITAGVVLLIAAAVVVTLLAGSGDPEQLPEGSPEARVQEYILAIENDDPGAAYAMLSDDLREQCSESDFRANVSAGRGTDDRVSLEGVDVFDDTAHVDVQIRSFSGSPPFDFSENTSEVRFVLRQVDSEWAITEAPWPYGGCYRLPPEPTATPTPTPSPTPSAAS